MTSSQTVSGQPFIYRATQAPSPQPTGFGSADAAISMLAPAIGRHILGMQDPKFLPRLGPGVSAYEAFYARDVTSPLYQQGREQQLHQLGGMFGETLGAVGNNLGINRFVDMSPTEFREQLQNAGQTSAGRMLTDQLTRSSAVQNIMGGDPMAIYDTAFRMKSLVGSSPGEFIHPRDVDAQTELTRRASEFGNEVTRGIYGRADGSMGVTPNASYTQNFRNEDLDALAETMFATDAQRIQGESGGVQAEKLRQMTRVMRSVADVTGGTDMRELLGSLDDLTQGDWKQVDPQALEQTFREIGATSRLLGITSEQMLATMQNVKATTNASLGISAEAQQLGVTGGGYTELPTMLDQAQRVESIGKQRGVSNDVRAMSQIEAQQTALRDIGMKSSRGQDIMHIAYLAQTGQITMDQYDEFRDVQLYGNTQQAESAAELALKQAYGSAEEGRRMFADPNIRNAMIMGTNSMFATNALSDISNAQGSEFTERVSRGLQRQAGSIAAGIRDRAGMGDNIILGEQAADLDMDFTEQYFASLEDPAAQVLAPELRDIYTRAQERAKADDPTISDADAKARAMDAVTNMVQTDSRFDPWRKDLETQRGLNATANEVQATADMSPELRARTVQNAGLDYLYNRGSSLDAGTEERVRELKNRRYEADMLRRQGKTAEAEAMNKSADEDYAKLRQEIIDDETMGAVEQGMLGNEDVANKQFTDAEKRVTATKIAEGRLATGEMFGGTEKDIVREQGILLKVMQDVQDGRISAEKADKLIAEEINSLDPAEKDRLRGAVNAGGATLTDALDEQGRVYNALEGQIQRTAGESGVSDVQSGISDAKTIHDYMRLLNGDPITGEGGLVFEEALMEATMNEVGNAMGLDKNFSQLLVDAATGEASLARVLGLEDDGQLNATLTGESVGRLDKSVKSAGEAKKAVKQSFAKLGGLTQNSEIASSGVGAQAMKAAKAMAEAAASGGLTDDKYAEIVADTMQSAAYLSDSGFADVSDALESHRAALNLTVTAATDAKAFDEGMSTQERQRIETQRRVNARTASIRAEEAAARERKLGISKYGGEFAKEIELGFWDSKLGEFGRTETALKTLGFGEDFGGWLGTSKDQLEAGLGKVSEMTPEEIAALSPEKQAAIKDLGDIRIAQQERGINVRKGEEGGPGGGGVGAGGTLNLTGTLTLYDKSGTEVGTVDRLKATRE